MTEPAALTDAIALILELIDDDREGLLKRLSKIGHAPNLQAYLRQCEERRPGKNDTRETVET